MERSTESPATFVPPPAFRWEAASEAEMGRERERERERERGSYPMTLRIMVDDENYPRVGHGTPKVTIIDNVGGLGYNLIGSAFVLVLHYPELFNTQTSLPETTV